MVVRPTYRKPVGEREEEVASATTHCLYRVGIYLYTDVGRSGRRMGEVERRPRLSACVCPPFARETPVTSRRVGHVVTVEFVLWGFDTIP